LSNNGNGECEYSLWDVYPFADFITYPSLYEGFGNAFLEAIYFKKPILINRYATFVRDIEPLGFDLAVMDGYLSRKTVQSVVEILEKPERRKQMVNYNYKVATRHYSYSVLRTRLNTILNYFFGSDVRGLSGKATFPIYEGMDIASHQTPHRHFDSHSFPRRSV
jgi:glycosyltransferase involved in cell wall biosynthesis